MTLTVNTATVPASLVMLEGPLRITGGSMTVRVAPMLVFVPTTFVTTTE